MGGVHLLDRFLGGCRPTVVGKMSYGPLSLNWVSMATITAWRIHVITHVVERKLDLIGFTRSIVASLLKN